MEQDNRTCWWREAIVYQIWPKSFYSGKGTSTGDIPGIIAKLDYIKSLGVNTIWLSPHYASPMVDEGYDISNYEDVNPMFGTLADAEQLIEECHQRQMKIIFDLVLTYTSDQHAWFKESRSSKTNPKSDWYIWLPAKYDDQGNRQPPNNWASAFHESAWTWDEIRKEYYLHLYSIHQPDLNWKNDECRQEMFQSAIEFWLKRGLDGFRVDTCDLYSKPKEFKDAPILEPKEPFQKCSYLITNGPKIHDYIAEMGKLFSKYDAMTVGELKITSKEQVIQYIDSTRNEFSMVFQFDVTTLGIKKGQRFEPELWTVSQLAKETEKLQSLIQIKNVWTTTFLENHDLARSVSRFGNPHNQFIQESCKMLCLYTIFQSGTPFLYQGQEIGMTNIPLEWDLKEYKDINTINFVKRLNQLGTSDQEIKKDYLSKINLLARDNARTPVQWTSGPNAGFTKEGVLPWMRINDNYKQINVQDQLDDNDSVLSFWKSAIEVRKRYPSLFIYGTFSLLLDYNKEQSILAFAKDRNKLYRDQNEEQQFKRAIVLLNFSDQQVQIPSTILFKIQKENAKILLSSHFIKDQDDPCSPLQPYEGRALLI